MAPIPPSDASPVTRRTLLGAAGSAALLALAGCNVSDPRIGGAAATSAPGRASASAEQTEPTPTASPTLPGAAAAAHAETAVAALAAALLTAHAELTASQRRVVSAARDAHRLHAAVLRTPDPTARSTSGASPAPSATPAKPAKVSLDALIAAEQSLAGQQARQVAPSRGLTALLFGSLSVAATTYASALGAKGNVPITKPPTSPAKPEVLDDVAGLQGVVAQLHALIYGYQVAIGRLSYGSASRDRALAGLTERRALRDQLIALLIARKAAAPAAEPAYVPSVKVHSAGTAGRLIATVETAFLPFTGQWLAAAAQPADQSLAWATMRRAASLARTWGGPIGAWPGWPS